MITNRLKRRRQDTSGVEQFLRRTSAVGMDVEPIVVCPHQREIQPPIVPRLQKAMIDGTVQEWTVVVVVPVENERVDAMVCGRGYLLRHHRRVGFVRVSPKRNVWLVVS